MTSPTPAPAVATCPACNAVASGKYCSNCGAPLAGAQCATCHTELTPGAKFCHRCGTPAGAPADAHAAAVSDRGIGSALPWAVAAITLVALIALLAGQRFGRSAAAVAPPASEPAAAASIGGGAPPDISQMTPQERAERLYDRVMALNERGRSDSVRFFAPMALQAYSMLGPLNADQRYDLGRIAAVSGEEGIARAQADSILAAQPQHLLGLLLAADAARLRGDRPAEANYMRRFTAAAPAEQAKQLPEYQQHVAEIDSRLARSSSR
ncbi:MAG: zinc ribbon domain-containing protein [Gemmatimonadaceae bacterium]